MGWFWTDAATTTSSAVATTTAAPSSSKPPQRPPHHPNMMAGGAEIPPECPMHRKPGQASPFTPPAAAAPPPPPPQAAPTSNILTSSPTFLSHDSSSLPETTPAQSDHAGATSKPWSTYLNPLNLMPTLSNVPSQTQTTILPTDRVISSIPKGHHPSEGNWEYPSPQQMYNAMLRKGYDDTPEDAVESMVDVHNFLNEGAWQEILEWERMFGGGMVRSFKLASGGGRVTELEEGEEQRLPRWDLKEEAGRELVEVKPRLIRFQGRPSEPSPKARMLNALGWVWPSRFGGDLPFDRHDWYVLRSTAQDEKNGTTGEARQVRYVIDYYSGPPEPTGEPVFYLDVRPALDRPGALFERGLRWGGEVWWKASGGEARLEETKRRKIREEDERLFGH